MDTGSEKHSSEGSFAENLWNTVGEDHDGYPPSSCSLSRLLQYFTNTNKENMSKDMSIRLPDYADLLTR